MKNYLMKALSGLFKGVVVVVIEVLRTSPVWFIVAAYLLKSHFGWGKMLTADDPSMNLTIMILVNASIALGFVHIFRKTIYPYMDLKPAYKKVLESPMASSTLILGFLAFTGGFLWLVTTVALGSH